MTTHSPPWRACVLTLFPEMFPGSLGLSLAGKALKEGIWSLETLDIRQFSSHKHHAVDDTPYGGGAGLVLMPDVIDSALKAAAKDGETSSEVIYLTPRGAPLTQQMVEELAQGPGVTVLCGRYEGVDQRVLDAHNVREISVGDYVLSGGEPAALVMLDACVRLLPNVMGNEATTDEESFSAGLLEYPHYTRPANWQGREVPDVLLSGHHDRIAAWRRTQAETVTRERRPDLWEKYLATHKAAGEKGNK
jgi:tRNA (guanine37-N1)-methyltransferase